MVDFGSPLGQKIQDRLEKEDTIWLTTVDSSSAPQPRPVWFHWDGETVLIFSQPGAAKLRHIAHNPKVALNFNTDAGGGDVAVLTGEAEILTKPLPASRVKAYLLKYQQGIIDIGLNPERMQQEYSSVIVVTPKKIRGF